MNGVVRMSRVGATEIFHSPSFHCHSRQTSKSFCTKFQFEMFSSLAALNIQKLMCLMVYVNVNMA